VSNTTKFIICALIFTAFDLGAFYVVRWVVGA
jgi:hypothetical protein